MDMITRIMQNEMEKRLKPQKVLLLYGARRVGKTILLKQIVQNFGGKSLVLNGESLDVIRQLEERSVQNYRRLFQGVQLLAIDEAQHIPGIGQKLKLIVDEVPDIRVIATGSSSFDLQNIAGEPLVGRSALFHLTPFSVEELKTTMSQWEIMQQLDSYLIHGHYPELFSMESDKEREEYLNEVVDAYLLRDILAVDGVKHAQKMHNLLRLIAYQAGSEVSLDELGSQLSLSRNTVERYLDLLQKVFVLYRIGGYARNLRKEVTKASKWYFYDTGIRNAVIGNLAQMESRTDVGALWENFCIAERMKFLAYQGSFAHSWFWRTQQQKEIDYLEEEDGLLRAVEFKWNDHKANSKCPAAFANAYPAASFQVITPHNIDSFLYSPALSADTPA